MAKQELKLYYFPQSYCSQKVRIMMAEKGVKYTPVIIDLSSGDHVTPAFMRQNPAGLVPILLDGDKVVKESENIVDYIDKKFPTETKLVPELSTEMGREVDKWRKTIHDLDIYQVTFGVAYSPELSTTGVKIHGRSKDQVLANMKQQIKNLEQLADEHPDLREAYLAKVAKAKSNGSLITDKKRTEKVLDELEGLFDKIEEKLTKVDADPSKELWFCGQQFTAADINLCILLNRLHHMGMSERYHDDKKRPRLHSYWLEANKRPSLKKYSVNVGREMMGLFMKKQMKKMLPLIGGLATVAIGVAMAFVFVNKRQV